MPTPMIAVLALVRGLLRACHRQQGMDDKCIIQFAVKIVERLCLLEKHAFRILALGETRSLQVVTIDGCNASKQNSLKYKQADRSEAIIAIDGLK